MRYVTTTQDYGFFKLEIDDACMEDTFVPVQKRLINKSGFCFYTAFNEEIQIQSLTPTAALVFGEKETLLLNSVDDNTITITSFSIPALLYDTVLFTEYLLEHDLIGLRDNNGISLYDLKSGAKLSAYYDTITEEDGIITARKEVLAYFSGNEPMVDTLVGELNTDGHLANGCMHAEYLGQDIPFDEKGNSFAIISSDELTNSYANLARRKK